MNHRGHFTLGERLEMGFSCALWGAIVVAALWLVMMFISWEIMLWEAWLLRAFIVFEAWLFVLGFCDP